MREKRNAAVLKGIKYMYRFLKKNNYKALYEIGDDAPSIFFEVPSKFHRNTAPDSILLYRP